MADTTEELLVKIRADLSELKAGMSAGAKVVKDGATGMEQAYDKVRGKVSLLNDAHGKFQALLAATGVAMVGRAIHQSLEYAESLKTVALRVGLTTDALQEWRYAANQQGLAQETLDSALSKFNITLGKARTEGAAAAGMFQRLGLEVKSFTDNDTALQAVIQRLREIKDPAQRAAMAFQLFGRQAGPKFAEFLTKSAEEFAKLRKEAHELGAVLDEQTIEKAKKAQDQLAALNQITKTQLTKALVDLAPIIIGVGNALAFSAEKLNEFVKGWRMLLGSVDEEVFDPLADQFKVLNGQILALENRLRAARKTMAEKGRFTLFGDDRQERIDKLLKQLAEVRKEHTKLAQQAMKGIPLNINADYLKQQSAQAAQTVADLRAKIAGTKEDIARLGEGSSRSAMVESMEKQLVELSNKATATKQDIASLGDTDGRRAALLESLETQMADLRTSIATTKQDIALLGDTDSSGRVVALEALQEQLEKAEARLTRFNNQLAQAGKTGVAAPETGGFTLERTDEENQRIASAEAELQGRLLQLRAAGADQQMALIRKTKTFSISNEEKEVELLAKSFKARKELVDKDAEARIKTLEKLKLSDEERAKMEQETHAAAEAQKTMYTQQGEQARQDIRDAYAAARIEKTLEELRAIDESEAASRAIREEEQRREQDRYLEWIGFNSDNIARLHSFEVMSAREKGSTIAQLTKDFANVMAGQSKKMFEVAKAASIAQTIMDTYAAAQAAFKAMAGIPIVGPALGAAAAAAAIASGMVRVNAIKSTSFGTKSAGGGGAGGGGVSGGGIGGASPTTPATGAGGPSVFISLPPGMNWYSQDFMRGFIERLGEAMGDGNKLKVVS